MAQEQPEGMIVTTEDVLRFLASAAMLEEIKAIRAKGKFGVMVARACPTTIAHQIAFQFLVNAFGPHHLIVLGSINTPLCFEVLLNYMQRAGYIQALVPNARVGGHPDFPGDNDSWMFGLLRLVQLNGVAAKDCVFVGGCFEDLAIYEEYGLQTHELNRYRSGMPRISGTETRDALMSLVHNPGTDLRILDGLINPVIQEQVRDDFMKQFALLKKRRW